MNIDQHHPPFQPAVADWIRILVANAARIVLVLVLASAFWSAGPALLGWKPTTVMSDSMMPRIATGDVVIARPVDPARLRIGQVLLVDDPDHAGRQRLHRLSAVAPEGDLILKGDANAESDSTPVKVDAVHGVSLLRVPYFGFPMIWYRQGQWIHLAALLAALALTMAATTADRRLTDDPQTPAGPKAPDEPPPADNDQPQGDQPQEDQPQDEGSPWWTPQGRLSRVLTSRRARGGLTACWVAPLILGLAVAAPVDAKLSSTTANAASKLASATYYTCASAVLAANPYLYYKFDETSGSTAADSSGNNRTGTFRGSGTTGGNARACSRDGGSAIALNGSSGFVASPTSITGPTTFTVEIWFKTSTSRGGKLIGFGNAATGASTTYDRHLYLTNSGQIVFGVYVNGTKVITSPDTYNDNEWHLATATLSNGGMRLFVDGEQVASNPGVTSAEPASGYWRIGYDNLVGWPSNPTSAYLAATLDDAAVYTTALAPSLISDHYEASR